MRFVANPGFESELRRDPANDRPVKDAADDTADAANQRIRQLYRPEVMSPFMPAGGFKKGAYGKQPVKVHRDQDGDIYVANHDHAAVMIEWGGAITSHGQTFGPKDKHGSIRRLGPVAPLRVAARRNARYVDDRPGAKSFSS